MNTLGGFLGISVLTSICHYFFQILVAKYLGQVEFSVFSVRWAELNMILLLGTWAHYRFALKESRDQVFRKWIKTGYVFSSLFIAFYFFSLDTKSLILAVISISIVHAIISGKILFMGDFKMLGGFNLLPAVLKVLILIIMHDSLKDSHSIFLILFFSILTSHLVFLLRPATQVNNKKDQLSDSGFQSSFILAFATSFFPLADLLWAEYFRDQSIINIIAPLSLVVRTVFFFQLIIAQWWLPKITTQNQAKPLMRLGMIFFMIAFASLFFSAGLQLIFKLMLGWTDIPSFDLFYLTSLGSGFMAIHYQSLQLLVVRGFKNEAWCLLLVVFLSWIILGITMLNTQHYLLIIGVVHALAFLFAQNKTYRKSN